MPRATFAAGAGLTRKSSLNSKQGTSFAGLRPGLGRAGVTKALSLVGKGGGLNPTTVYYMNQVGGVGRRHSRKCGGPPCSVMRYSSPTPKPTSKPHEPPKAEVPKAELSLHDALHSSLYSHLTSHYGHKAPHTHLTETAHIILDLMSRNHLNNTYSICLIWNPITNTLSIVEKSKELCECENLCAKVAERVFTDYMGRDVTEEGCILDVNSCIPTTFTEDKYQLSLYTWSLILEQFDHLDLNHDGVLDEHEMHAGGFGPEVIAEMDINNDGVVEHEEFVDFVELIEEGKGVDINEDNKISSAELFLHNESDYLVNQLMHSFKMCLCLAEQMITKFDLSIFKDITLSNLLAGKTFHLYYNNNMTLSHKQEIVLEHEGDTVTICLWLPMTMIEDTESLKTHFNNINYCYCTASVGHILNHSNTNIHKSYTYELGCKPVNNDLCTELADADTLYYDIQVLENDHSMNKCKNCSACHNKEDLQVPGLYGEDDYNCQEYSEDPNTEYIIIKNTHSDIYNFIILNHCKDDSDQCKTIKIYHSITRTILNTLFLKNSPKSFTSKQIDLLVHEVLHHNHNKKVIHDSRTLGNTGLCLYGNTLKFSTSTRCDSTHECFTDSIVLDDFDSDSICQKHVSEYLTFRKTLGDHSGRHKTICFHDTQYGSDKTIVLYLYIDNNFEDDNNDVAIEDSHEGVDMVTNASLNLDLTLYDVGDNYLRYVTSSNIDEDMDVEKLNTVSPKISYFYDDHYHAT